MIAKIAIVSSPIYLLGFLAVFRWLSLRTGLDPLAKRKAHYLEEAEFLGIVQGFIGLYVLGASLIWPITLILAKIIWPIAKFLWTNALNPITVWVSERF